MVSDFALKSCFTRFQPYDLHFFLAFSAQSHFGFLWQMQYVTFRLFFAWLGHNSRIVRLDFRGRSVLFKFVLFLHGMATARTTNRTSALHSFIYWDVGEPTRHPCSTTGMMQDIHLKWSHLERLLAEMLCHREEVPSVMRIVLFCFDFGRHLAFCFSPVLVQRENS